MKAVIFAGGYGTRLSERTDAIPKPMVEIGGRPILWHIMKIYSQFGVNDFVICCGYKQQVIKDYFANFFLYNSDVTLDLSDNSMEIHNSTSENWRVTLVDTGLDTFTGGRLKRVQPYVGRERFFLTYGDGVADINIAETLAAHIAAGKKLSMTVYLPQGKLGVVDIDDTGGVRGFIEKPRTGGNWINAGFFVCEPEVFDVLEGDQEMFEQEPMQKLVTENQVHAFKHFGFWRPMDTLHDNKELNKLWNAGNAPWKIW